MRWRIKYMTDPGDGIVSENVVEHDSDDICEVAADIMNGETPIGGDCEDDFYYLGERWLFGLEAVPK